MNGNGNDDLWGMSVCVEILFVVFILKLATVDHDLQSSGCSGSPVVLRCL